MKKLTALLVAILMIFGMNTTVFAGSETSDNTTIPVLYMDKSYGTSTIIPLEEITFTLEEMTLPESITGNIVVPPLTVKKPANSTKIEITVPEYTVPGLYKYKFSEDDMKTAGVTYNPENKVISVNVLVERIDGTNQLKSSVSYGIEVLDAEGNVISKSDTFTNKFESQSLTISKLVTGNQGDKAKIFYVDVVVTAPTGTFLRNEMVATGIDTMTYTPVAGTDLSTYTFSQMQIKEGSGITITGLPVGAIYTVTETGYEAQYYTGTTVSLNGAADADGATTTSTIISGQDETVEFTNNYEQAIATGISLDNIPYILMIGFAVAGIAFFVLRRRNTVEE